MCFRYQWVFPLFYIAEGWLRSHRHPSPQGLLKEFCPEFPWNRFLSLMILRTGWCHAPVHGVLGTEGLTPAECVFVCVYNVICQGKAWPTAWVFNEASKECGGWTGCISEALPEPVNETSSLSEGVWGVGVTGRLHVRLNLKNFIIRALTKRRVRRVVRSPAMNLAKYYFFSSQFCCTVWTEWHVLTAVLCVWPSDNLYQMTSQLDCVTWNQMNTLATSVKRWAASSFFSFSL